MYYIAAQKKITQKNIKIQNERCILTQRILQKYHVVSEAKLKNTDVQMVISQRKSSH
jgi:hypothetical protein